MKKFSSLAAAAALLGGGLVAGAPAAQAGEPYPHTVKTECNGKALNNPRIPHRARFAVRVDPKRGSAAPEGKLIVQWKRMSNNTVAYKRTFHYEGPGYTKYSVPTKGKLPADKYKVNVDFKPGNSSVFKGSDCSFTQTVKKKKRR